MSAQRATSIPEVQNILKALFTREGVASGLAFEPRPSDVIISPYSKCGTTWMQQIVHSLRTRGSMDFGEITEVMPWIDAAADLGQDLNANQVATPRAFKSHLAWDAIPKGGRYICVVRDPVKAMISMYKFFEGWLMEAGSVDVNKFGYELFLARRAPSGYWHHLASWVEQRDNPDVLLLCYEELLTSFQEQLPVIASFIGVTLDKELRDIVTENSSMAFMRDHGTHFDDHFLRKHRDNAMGLPEESESSKVSSSTSSQNRPTPSDQLLADMQARWKEEVTPRIGFESYEALRASF